MTEIERISFSSLKNSLTEEKKIDCHYLLPLIQTDRMCVAHTPGAVKWESVKEYLHLSTNLFPNNKSSLPVTHLAGVVFDHNETQHLLAKCVASCSSGF